MSLLVNRINKNELKDRLAHETFKRVTLSFYRYVKIDDPQQLRDSLYKQWSEMNCFGRIYLAHEGVNAQMSVPEKNWELFVDKLYRDPRFKDIPFKFAVDGNGKSFYKLVVKLRE